MAREARQGGARLRISGALHLGIFAQPAPRLIGLTLLGLFLAAPAAGELRDPTRPPEGLRPASASQAAPRQWLLSATLVADGRRVAVINGRPVGENEVIDGALVVRIGPETALLRQGGREFTLRLKASDQSFSKTIREEMR